MSSLAIRMLPRAVQRSLRAKLVAVFTALLLGICGVIWFQVPHWVYGRNVQEAARHASSLAAVTAYSVAPALIFEDSVGIAEVLSATRLEGDVAYMIITDQAQRVVASWRRDSTAAPIRLTLDAEGADGELYLTQERVLDTAGYEIGRVYLGLSLVRLHAEAGAARRWIGLLSFLLLLGGMAAVSLVSHVLTRPLKAVVATAERIAAGDLAARAPSGSGDEVSILSASFNSMVEKLSAAHDELQDANRTLEARVAARTEALRREGAQRRQAELARLDTERRFRTMFESAALGIALFETDGRACDVNPALLRMLGAESTPPPATFPEFFDDQHIGLVHASFAEVAGGRSPSNQFEARLLVSGGSAGNVHVVLSAVADTSGLHHVIAMIADISEQRRLEEMYRQSQKLEAIGQLAGGVAHDFNNLLTTINGISELLLADLEPGSPMHDDVRMVQEAGVRAAALTRQLLAFSRKQVLRLEPTSLNEVVYGLTKMLARLLTEDISCTTQLEAGLSSVRADRAQLEQVIINLCLNAKDAMPQGGQLTIATRSFRIGAPEAELLGVQPAEYVELAVRDNGTGMDEATRARIFEPFYTTKDVGHGTGLGLATVYGIITQSGGTITVESTPGAGSSFRVLLPAIHGSLELPGEAAPEVESAGTGTVLVMEDEDQVRALFCRVLRRAGYQVLEASNGIDAASVSEQFAGPIDLVISDVIMPGMNGPEAVSRLIVRRPNLRILYISGYTRDLALKKGLSDQRVNYIEKPVSPTLLRRAVHNLIHAPEDVLAPDELIGNGERASR